MNWFVISSLIAWWLLKKQAPTSAPVTGGPGPIGSSLSNGSGVLGVIGLVANPPTTGETSLGTVQTGGVTTVLPGAPPTVPPSLAVRPALSPAIPIRPQPPGKPFAPVSLTADTVPVQPVAPWTQPGPPLTVPGYCANPKLPPDGSIVLLPPGTPGANQSVLSKMYLRPPYLYHANGYELLGILGGPSDPADGVAVSWAPYPSALWDSLCRDHARTVEA